MIVVHHRIAISSFACTCTFLEHLAMAPSTHQGSHSIAKYTNTRYAQPFIHRGIYGFFFRLFCGSCWNSGTISRSVFHFLHPRWRRRHRLRGRVCILWCRTWRTGTKNYFRRFSVSECVCSCRRPRHRRRRRRQRRHRISCKNNYKQMHYTAFNAYTMCALAMTIDDDDDEYDT